MSSTDSFQYDPRLEGRRTENPKFRDEYDRFFEEAEEEEIDELLDETYDEEQEPEDPIEALEAASADPEARYRAGIVMCSVCCACFLVAFIPSLLLSLNIIPSNPGTPTPAPPSPSTAPTPLPNNTWPPVTYAPPSNVTPSIFPTPPPPIQPDTTLNPQPVNNYTTVPQPVAICDQNSDCLKLAHVATATCINGSCFIDSCSSPFENCNNITTDGCEANTMTDPFNCDACGRACNYTNGVAGCSGGVCFLSGCVSGWANCNSSTLGCFYSIRTDPLNCGACGFQCVLFQASPVCNNFSCAVGSCNLYYANCDLKNFDGCEVFTPTDVNNCGVCGNVCPYGPSSLCGLGNCYVKPKSAPPAGHCPATGACSICASGQTSSGNCTLSGTGFFCSNPTDCINPNTNCNNQNVCGQPNI